MAKLKRNASGIAEIKTNFLERWIYRKSRRAAVDGMTCAFMGYLYSTSDLPGPGEPLKIQTEKKTAFLKDAVREAYQNILEIPENEAVLGYNRKNLEGPEPQMLHTCHGGFHDRMFIYVRADEIEKMIEIIEKAKHLRDNKIELLFLEPEQEGGTYMENDKGIPAPFARGPLHERGYAQI